MKIYFSLSRFYLLQNIYCQVSVGYYRSNGLMFNLIKDSTNYTQNDNYSTMEIQILIREKLEPLQRRLYFKRTSSTYSTPTSYSFQLFRSNLQKYLHSFNVFNSYYLFKSSYGSTQTILYRFKGQYYINSNGNKTYVNN
jgi:hypothetical protein